jgi:hypothetical protein
MIGEGHISALEIKKASPAKPGLKAILDGTATETGNEHDPDDPDALPDDDAAFNRNINKFKDIAFTTYARALKKCEPSIFTEGNLKSMRKRGQAKTSLEDMLTLVEHLCDIDKDDTIDLNSRTRRKVISFICQTYDQKGRRGQGMVMPPDYTSSGPLQTLTDEGRHVARSPVEVGAENHFHRDPAPR